MKYVVLVSFITSWRFYPELPKIFSLLTTYCIVKISIFRRRVCHNLQLMIYRVIILIYQSLNEQNTNKYVALDKINTWEIYFKALEQWGGFYM